MTAYSVSELNINTDADGEAIVNTVLSVLLVNRATAAHCYVHQHQALSVSVNRCACELEPLSLCDCVSLARLYFGKTTGGMYTTGLTVYVWWACCTGDITALTSTEAYILSLR